MTADNGSVRCVLALFLIGAGCDHNATGTAAEDARAFRASVDKIWCETVFNCCALPGYASVDACVAGIKSASSFLNFGPAPEPQPDPTMWDQSRADACLVELRAATSCDHLVQSADYFSALCRAAYTPALVVGESCSTNMSPACDLDRGATCLPSQVCGLALEDGQPCDGDNECRSLYCFQTCQPAKPVHVWLCGT
jgi:hypothetical protein